MQASALLTPRRTETNAQTSGLCVPSVQWRPCTERITSGWLTVCVCCRAPAQSVSAAPGGERSAPCSERRTSTTLPSLCRPGRPHPDHRRRQRSRWRLRNTPCGVTTRAAAEPRIPPPIYDEVFKRYEAAVDVISVISVESLCQMSLL